MSGIIYEIRNEMLKPEDWARASELGNAENQINGMDYDSEILNADERVEAIDYFFSHLFPNNSFEIVNNKSNETAYIKFVGNIRELYEQWIANIKRKADEINIEDMDFGLYEVHCACDEPFGLSSKFYIPDWTGCTGSAGDFMDYLRHRSEESDGEPVVFYVGQVFDYYF